MYHYYLKRWLLFFFVGLPIQAILYVLYPFLAAYFWFFVRGRHGYKITPPSPRWPLYLLAQLGRQDPIRDNFYLANDDAHGPLTHMYLWILRPDLARKGMENLVYLDGIDVSDGCVKRRYPVDDPQPISGDALSAWVSSAQRFSISNDILRKVAKHYLRNCMGLGAYPLKWQVSNRSSNSGINTVADGWKGINQPAIGPQYFTSAALLMLAAKRLGGLWWTVYWAHWLLMGGWLWTLLPFIHLPNNSFYYSQQITLLNLVTLYNLTHNPIYKWSIRYIVIHCAPQGNANPMFYCWAASVGALTPEEVAKGEEGLMCIKPTWPQYEPLTQGFYDHDLNSPIFSLAGGAAKLFKGDI